MSRPIACSQLAPGIDFLGQLRVLDQFGQQLLDRGVTLALAPDGVEQQDTTLALCGVFEQLDQFGQGLWSDGDTQDAGQSIPYIEIEVLGSSGCAYSPVQRRLFVFFDQQGPGCTHCRLGHGQGAGDGGAHDIVIGPGQVFQQNRNRFWIGL